MLHAVRLLLANHAPPHPRGGSAAAGRRRATLLSPHGTTLHGHHRGRQAVFAEPLESWLTILAAAVPLYKDCLVVCPYGMSETRAALLARRARVHFPNAQVVALQPRQSSTIDSSSRNDNNNNNNNMKDGGNAVATTTTSPRFVSPLHTLPAGSMDVVVFAGNVFADEMLYDAPWHVSSAHRLLRAHGVLGIVGHSPYICAAAPEWAAEDLHDYRAAADALAQDTVTRLCSAVSDSRVDNNNSNRASRQSSCGVDDAQLAAQALKQALEMEESAAVAHADVYLPFCSVRRRWLTSEYAMTPDQVAASLRARRPYQVMHHHVFTISNIMEEEPFSSSSSSTSHAARAAPMEEDDHKSDFVDVSSPMVNEHMNIMGNNSGGEDDDNDHDGQGGFGVAKVRPPIVQRRLSLVDPLEALQRCWHARLHYDGSSSRGSGRGGDDGDGSAAVRVHVEHFVVTCSNRRINAEEPPLVASRGERRSSLPSPPSRLQP